MTLLLLTLLALACVARADAPVGEGTDPRATSEDLDAEASADLPAREPDRAAALHAHADPRATPPEPADDPAAPRSRLIHTLDESYGFSRLDLEARLVRLELQPIDIEVVDARFQEAIPAPARSRAEYRAAAWASVYGSSRLTVEHRRLVDGTTTRKLSQEHVERDHTLVNPPLELCLEDPMPDPGAIQLEAWPTLPPAPALDWTVPGSRSTMMLAHGDQPTALVGLAPGESVTMMEVIADDGQRRRAPRRHFVLQQRGRTVTITQDDTSMRLCVQYAPLDLSPRVARPPPRP